MTSRRLRVEHAWWLFLVAWGLLVVLWRPEPPASFLEVPSASARPLGFAIFHDMLEGQTEGTRRVLGGVSMMSDDVQVLVALTPTEVLPEGEREDMLDWVSSGGTLIVGHPLRDKEGGYVTAFAQGGMWPVSVWSESTDKFDANLKYIPMGADPPRDVPPFGHVMRGEIILADFGAEAMLVADDGEVAASLESYGGGQLIQLADSGILDNRSIGWKQSHLFAAALIDEVGRDKIWAFDESHEGVDTEPSLMVYLGSGRWRAILLQSLLLLLILYWWRTSRLGRPALAPSDVNVREVTTLARDVGDFYFRAQQSRWALSRSLELFKLILKERGVAAKVREEALAIASRAQQELDSGSGNVEKHAFLVRKMAHCQQKLALERKGKKR